ncbi:T9SS type A sorting domain-containing protein [Taibaiella lutea]|uniref:T9SS type A sorting domain-containing protein n=1 Tax=Taibaiella lutea TaxID=2608001 RepID=A0A5M6CAG6_9BACT|nr:tail fiber domain-containing protein [Taibaiella lutea]KAA5532114.1 T9SS type A sorting domain-containing protein [Taibaiella lutea]
MKSIKTALPNVFGKTKNLQLILGVVATAAFSNNLNAQNTSYNANTIPVSGSSNCAFGLYSLLSNTTGICNTAGGFYSLNGNVGGNYNSAFGYQALYGNKVGNNTSMGFRSSYLTTTGANNTAMGYGALYNNHTGSNNTAIGYLADVGFDTLFNATAIGNGTIVNASNKIRIGDANITLIEGAVPFTPSDGRFKTNVKEEDVKGLEFIKKLRPVVYNFDTKKLTEFWTRNMPDTIRNKYINQDFTASTNIRQSGFIAQEVEQAAKEVHYNFNGLHVPESENDNYSIAYSQFVIPLVKGMQEQQKMIEDQKQMIDKLQQQINDMQKGLGSATGIGNALSVTGASMDQNVPNPFSTETVISFNLPNQIGNAYMTVYDLSGKQIKTLPISKRGASSITITSDQLEAGMYIYSIVADGKIVDSKRMVVTGK